MTNDVEHHIMCLLAVSVSSFDKYSFRFFALKKKLDCILIIVLCFFWMQAPYQMLIFLMDIFSPFVSCLFILIVSFEA